MGWLSVDSSTVKHGVDLNRTFPIRWAPFEMFGMDGGVFLSVRTRSESIDGCRDVKIQHRCRDDIAHLYWRSTDATVQSDTDLPKSDISMLQGLAEQLGSRYWAIKCFVYILILPMIQSKVLLGSGQTA